MGRVIAVVNEKGGVAKTSVTASLGIGLARQGQAVLLIDADPQGSLTVSLGLGEPDELKTTITDIMMTVVNEEDYENDFGILHHPEGIDLIPANIELSGMEVSLQNVIGRESILREYIDWVRNVYDWILIDCMPSLGMMTINALVAADKVLIPVQAAYLPVKGLQQLIRTVLRVKRQLNPELEIEGILLTMVDFRTNYARDIAQRIREGYGDRIRIFEQAIPFSVRAAEATAEGVSIFSYDPKGKVAQAYEQLTREVMGL